MWGVCGVIKAQAAVPFTRAGVMRCALWVFYLAIPGNSMVLFWRSRKTYPLPQQWGYCFTEVWHPWLAYLGLGKHRENCRASPSSYRNCPARIGHFSCKKCQ